MTRGQLSESKIRNRVRVVSGNDGLGVRGLEERHGGSVFSLEESGVETVEALVSVVSFVLATETSDAGVRDAVSASNHFARFAQKSCHLLPRMPPLGCACYGATLLVWEAY